jgi:hypothetical protein
MPTCTQCGSVLEPAAVHCTACGARAAQHEMGVAERSGRLRPSMAPAGAFHGRAETMPHRVRAATLIGAAPHAPQASAAALAVQATEPVERALRQIDVVAPPPSPERDASESQVLSLRPNAALPSVGPPPVAAGTLPLHGNAALSTEDGPSASPLESAGPAIDASSRRTPSGQFTAARTHEGSRLTPSAQSAGRPPVLASEALRKDIAPASPAPLGVRRVTAALGILGAGATLVLGGPSGLALPVGGAFLALTLLGLVPMPYHARATALVTVAGSGLAVVTWSRLEQLAGIEPLVLLIGVLLLGMALLFRAWHRASLLSRALVAIGATVCAGWLSMSGALPRLLILEAGFQHWLPAVLVAPLIVVLLLALLAFMDSRSTGGCTAWAALLLSWFAAYSWAELLPLYLPAQARGLDLARVAPELVVPSVAIPLFAAVLAAGLAQLLSVATAEVGE